MKENNMINITKFILSIFVIAIHTHLSSNFDNYYIVRFIDIITQIAVPFFFITTGYFIGIKIFTKNKLNNQAESVIIKNRNKLLKLYIIFTIIYFPLSLIEYFSNGNSLIFNILLYIRGFVFVGQHFNSYMLWYLLSGFYGLLLIQLLLKKKNLNLILIVGVILFLIGIGIDLLVLNESIFNGCWHYVIKLITLVIPDGRILTSVLFFTIGIYISQNKIKTNNLIIMLLLLLMILIQFFVNIYISKIINVFVCTGLFILIVSYCPKKEFKSQIFRFLSTDLYFWHMYIWTFLYYFVVGKSNQYSCKIFFLTTLFSIIFSIVHYLIFNYKSILPKKVDRS